ncbi:MAG: hypothetical protein QXP99_05270 [Thermoproteota archaeon]
MYGWPAGLPLIPLLTYLKVKGILVLTTPHNVGTLRGFDPIPKPVKSQNEEVLIFPKY